MRRRWSDLGGWSERGRRAVAGVGLYAIASGCDVAAYMAMIPLITRSVSPTVFGQLSLLLVGAQVLLMIIDLGIGTAVLREFRVDEDPERRRTVLATALWFRLLVASFTGLALFAASFAAASPMREALHLSAPTLLLWSMFGGLCDYFRVLERHADVAIATMLRSAVWALAIPAFVVYGGYALIGLVLAYGISYAAAVAVLCWRMGLAAMSKRPDWTILRALVRFGSPIGGYYVLRALLASDRYIVKYRSSVADAGLVQLASIPGGALEILEKSIVLPGEPYLYGVAVEERASALTRLVRLTAFAMGSCAAMVAMFAPEMVQILAPKSYGAALSVIAWYTFAAIHRSITRLMGIGASLVGNTRLYLISSVLELLLTVPALYFLVPYAGVAAAGYARYAAAVLSLLYAYRLLRAVWPIALPIGSICFYMAFAPLVATLFATTQFGVVAPLPVRALLAVLLVAGGYPIIMRPPGRRFTWRKR